MSASTVSVRQLLAGRDFAVGDDAAAQMANYVYAVVDDASRAALLVDPAWDPGGLLSLLEEGDLELTGVALTHYHADHAGGSLAGLYEVPGVAELLERADVPVHVQGAEAPWVLETTGVAPSSLVVHGPGDEIALGDSFVTSLHTPGHTPGSQCLLAGGALVTGDTLFLHGCGRTDLPGGDPVALYDSLVALTRLPGELEVFCGHAYDRNPHADLESIRRTNPVLWPLDEQDWLARFTR